MLEYLKEIFYLLGDSRRKLPGLILLFLGVSVLELAGISLIGTYVTLIANQGQLDGILLRILENFGISLEQNSLLIFLGNLLIGIFIFKAVSAIGINYVITRFSFHQQVRLQSSLMQAYQSMPYTEYLLRNSSEYIHNTQVLPGQVSGNVVLVLLRAISDSLVAIIILVYLLFTNSLALMLLVVLLGAVVLSFDYLSRSKLEAYGRKIISGATSMIQGINEGMEGFKEIRILGREIHFFQKVHNSAKIIFRLRTKKTVIVLIPRYMLEVMIVSFIVLLVFTLLMLGMELKIMFPTLAMFGVAALRVLPAANSITSALADLRFGRNSVSILYKDLKEIGHNNIGNYAENKKIIFEKFQSFKLNNINFRYPKTQRDVLRGINFEIKVGESIGLIGPSGSGKTTMVDLILGLLEPQKGELIYNGKNLDANLGNWRSQVAYLPQQVFIIDNTLRCNVALGVEDKDINENLILEALKKARLAELVERLPKGINTILGERGVRLSGGQRQRVALARAFYHKRNVLIMDESTSALDIETERRIVEEIKNLKGRTTIIVIAHRLTTVQHCDRIYRLDGGRIIAVGPPREILK